MKGMKAHLAPLMLATAIGFAAPAVASPPTPLPPPDSPVVFNAGEACDFPLELALSGSRFHFKPFLDHSGNLVRVMIAGKGSTMTFTNLEPDGGTLSLNAYGFSVKETSDADGIITDTITGHVLVIRFPTDVPAGPSTTLYVGRLVQTTDTNTGVGTFQSFSGKQTDICAALD